MFATGNIGPVGVHFSRPKDVHFMLLKDLLQPEEFCGLEDRKTVDVVEGNTERVSILWSHGIAKGPSIKGPRLWVCSAPLSWELEDWGQGNRSRRSRVRWESWWSCWESGGGQEEVAGR